MKKDNLIIAKKKFKSRLIVGTGKYKTMSECAKAIKLSGAEIVTVAVRRVNISDKNKPLLMDYIDPKKITYLPNTAGCFNSKEALRTLRLAREIGGWKLVKLEVLGDKENLFPDMIETLKSTEVLTKEGFPIKVFSILPELYDCLPAITAFLNARAISNGFFAFAIAVFTNTPSQPSSIAIVASEACPRPASIINGSFVCFLII